MNERTRCSAVGGVGGRWYIVYMVLYGVYGGVRVFGCSGGLSDGRKDGRKDGNCENFLIVIT